MSRIGILSVASLLILATLACTFSLGNAPTVASPTSEATPVASAEIIAIQPTSTPLPPMPPAPVQPGSENPEEPVFVHGEIPYTSPFFLNTISQPFVMLEDQAGFVQRDREFQFPPASQVLGSVEIHDDGKLTYNLSLPAVPQGTQVDVDNNGQENQGVQVFAVAYWSNTWRDTFLEPRDGTGWSTAYASTISDAENDDEISGGLLVVWSPDDAQSFPTAFGEDGKLFTADDPTAAIPAGYNLVDLDQEPFRVYKEAQPDITLHEGAGAVNDFSDLGYAEVFSAMIEKVSKEYPFTAEKSVDWQALEDEFMSRADQARSTADFYRALRDLTYRIPDAHVNVSFNNQVFFEERGGGVGLVLAELSDGKVIVSASLPNLPAALAGIQAGAEITQWNDKPILEAIQQEIPYFGPYSTEHARRIGQVNFLTRMPPDTGIEVSYINPGTTQVQQASLKAVAEYDSLFKTLAGYDNDKMALPIESHTLKDSNLVYMRINTFSDDYQLMARLWDYYIDAMIDEEMPGLVIDLRTNSGGSFGIALDFAGYFFDQEISLFESRYYSEATGAFEKSDYPVRIKPAPKLYEGKIAVLVSSDCVSACEGFAYALQQNGRATVIGHTPTAGAFGEVGQGQYKLPDDISMQFPTGRPELPDGSLVIEGSGVIPDITVPVTAESVLGSVDALLEAAIQALTK